jgi:hypothetical protein
VQEELWQLAEGILEEEEEELLVEELGPFEFSSSDICDIEIR